MRLFVLGLLLAAPAVAAEPVFAPAAIKAHVEFLADDLLEGRGTGTRGHEIAAHYVAAQFAAAGLKPGARGGSWFQPVKLQERRHGDTPAMLTITGAAGAKRFAHGDDALMSISRSAATTDVEAELVFVGFGMDAQAQGFDDYAGLDVRGKIVVVLGGAPKGPPNETWVHLQSGSEKAKMAAARGAIGMIFVPTIIQYKASPWAQSQAYKDVPSMTWSRPDGTAFDPAPAIRASATLNVVAATTLFEAAPMKFAAVQAVADAENGRPKGFALPLRARITGSAKFREVVSPNVIGVLPGSDPKLASEHVVLMGHLDHLGVRPEREGDKIYNGALDNAAGTAAMIEVARAFGSGPRTKRPLMFVAVTAEEKGLLGAEGFANDPPVPIGDIASVVNLDMPLLRYGFTDINAYGDGHSTMGPAIARAVGRAGVKSSPDPWPERSIFVRSDHYALVKRGVPSVMLATGHANGGRAAWEAFFATNYHQPSDDLSQPIDWAAGAKFARVNFLISRELANAPQRALWYAGDFFGETFAAAAPKAAAPKGS